MERRDELHRHGCSIAKQTILTTHPSGLQTRVSVELANFDAVCVHSECKTKKPTWESPFMGRRGLLGGVSANVTPVLGRRSDAVNEGRLSQQCTPVMRRREMDSPGGSPLPVRREFEEEGCDVDNSVISGWLKFRDNKRWKSRWGVVTKLSPAAEVRMSFKDKVVIVTGASSGIGAAVAVGFGADGARVVMVGRNENKLAAVAARCNNPLVVKADVANDEEARRIINQTVEHFGQIDILVNNAGISSWGNLVSGKIIESNDKIMPVNLRAVVLLTSLATPYLIKTKGNVINISSIGGQLPATGPSGSSMYFVSKAALNHFGLCAAAELAPHGVRVNTISPGPVVTDMIENLNASITWDVFKKMTALDRVSEPEEIADLVMFIASDKAKAITGSNQVIDNGTLIKRE